MIKKEIINEILNFNPAELLNLNLSPEEKDRFNASVLENLIKRILYISIGRLKDREEEKNNIMLMLENNNVDIQKVFQELSEKIEGFSEIVLGEFLKIRSEIKKK